MRACLLALLLSPALHAATVNLPGETGAPIDEDDWSIPLQRCLRSSERGVGVYDGAERCTIAFPLPLAAGHTVTRVRALYEDDDANSQFRMRLRIRDAAYSGDLDVVSDKDDDPSLTVLEVMTLETNHLLDKNDAASIIVEVRGDTRLLAVSYEYD